MTCLRPFLEDHPYKSKSEKAGMGHQFKCLTNSKDPEREKSKWSIVSGSSKQNINPLQNETFHAGFQQF